MRIRRSAALSLYKRDIFRHDFVMTDALYVAESALVIGRGDNLKQEVEHDIESENHPVRR